MAWYDSLRRAHYFYSIIAKKCIILRWSLGKIRKIKLTREHSAKYLTGTLKYVKSKKHEKQERLSQTRHGDKELSEIKED